MYPATTGASYIDYLIGDAIVSPPEHAPYFTEKLVLLPNSYQVNYYTSQVVGRADDHVARAAHAKVVAAAASGTPVNETQLRSMFATDEQMALFAGAGSSTAELQRFDPDDRTQLGLPAVGAGVVFANFNKNEKLEPLSFSVWMSILRRVRGSVLWLLSPAQSGASDEQVMRLKQEALAHGIHPSRLIFAARCEKDIHLARHRHVDLFLDSLVVCALLCSCATWQREFSVWTCCWGCLCVSSMVRIQQRLTRCAVAHWSSRAWASRFPGDVAGLRTCLLCQCWYLRCGGAASAGVMMSKRFEQGLRVALTQRHNSAGGVVVSRGCAAVTAVAWCGTGKRLHCLHLDAAVMTACPRARSHATRTPPRT